MSGGLQRARRLLMRPQGWIEAAPAAGGYAVRIGADRRARVQLVLGEADFRALIADPGLKARAGGGWRALRSGEAARAAPPPGRPGLVEGRREVMEADGRMHPHRANLTGSAIAWLSGRSDAEGRPWIERAERAAADRLGDDAEIALAGPSLTMRWDALPRSGGGSAARFEPGDRAMSAARRVEAALSACGPARRMVEHICVHASSLQAAEQALGLQRRAGKALLKQGLRALAAHYRIG
ncbi:DUF6456 domain-containing protein [Roseibacterium beibuensis]|uniref:DUF6456 domain-containing protein n=1 Tax=[Roseibacterium] beibuensis TaxID=1193142 RepID=UPI00217E7F53|nr:DUF6456 domain-containing protein [Roseibacterium beibuensis]MCS6622889.1 DUF6456 domain-containing protein [Roseibacterium beibuensis]